MSTKMEQQSVSDSNANKETITKEQNVTDSNENKEAITCEQLVLEVTSTKEQNVTDSNENKEAITCEQPVLEVTSTTEISDEHTKRSLRVKTWRIIQDNKWSLGFHGIFNRIPCFLNNEKAAELFASTDEFKASKHIKINIDRALYSVKMQTLLADKNLYLPATRNSSALYLHVDVPEDATDEQKKSVLNVQDVQLHRTEIDFDNRVKFDMVVIGSVVVSRDGYRIGRGNGFNDLDIGFLIEIGSITPDTIIATFVHDVQVVQELPKELFQKYDAPVDLIITPTEVIRVANRLPRPTGIFWDILSKRRLAIIPSLKAYKESLEKDSKEIVLKEIDTDVEQHQNNRSHGKPFRGGNHRYHKRYNRNVSQNNGSQLEDNQQQPRGFFRRRRRVFQHRRRTTKSEGDTSIAAGTNQPQQKSNFYRKQHQRKYRNFCDFCVKLSDITRDVRVKDLKSELRKRDCHPLYISWKGQFGKCFLYFGNRNGIASTDEDMDKVIQSLSELSLILPSGDDNKPETEGTDKQGNNVEGEDGQGDGPKNVVAIDGAQNVAGKGDQANDGDAGEGDGAKNVVAGEGDGVKNVVAGEGDGAKNVVAIDGAQNVAGKGDQAKDGDAGEGDGAKNVVAGEGDGAKNVAAGEVDGATNVAAGEGDGNKVELGKDDEPINIKIIKLKVELIKFESKKNESGGGANGYANADTTTA